MFRDKGRYISGWYKLCFEHIQSWQHIQVYSLVGNPQIQANKNKQLVRLILYIDCWVHMVMADKDF